ncbi:MAG: DUF1697 domain-containing protein [Candidatus Bathyarchaeota archaeon]|nr:DUF1697 domain-containing protein [Candidatus Bathyarchaeota archaeon]
MTRYVAFLRGINVGGHTVKKETLQKIYESLGYQDVSVYRQSGNVIFQTPKENTQEIKTQAQSALKATLGYDVAVLLRTLPQLKAIIDSNPFYGQGCEGTRFLVTFLPAAPDAFPLLLPYTIPKSTAEIIGANSAEVFSVTHGGGEGALPNPFLEKVLKVKATTRNLNVIKEIAKRFS